MKNLTNMIKQRANDSDVQISRAKKVSSHSEIMWIKCKQAVDLLSPRFEEVFAEKLREDANSVRKVEERRSTLIEVEMEEVIGYRVILQMRETDDRGVIDAKYVAFNTEKGVVYIRDLFNI